MYIYIYVDSNWLFKVLSDIRKKHMFRNWRSKSAGRCVTFFWKSSLPMEVVHPALGRPSFLWESRPIQRRKNIQRWCGKEWPMASWKPPKKDRRLVVGNAWTWSHELSVWFKTVVFEDRVRHVGTKEHCNEAWISSSGMLLQYLRIFCSCCLWNQLWAKVKTPWQIQSNPDIFPRKNEKPSFSVINWKQKNSVFSFQISLQHEGSTKIFPKYDIIWPTRSKDLRHLAEFNFSN